MQVLTFCVLHAEFVLFWWLKPVLSASRKLYLVYTTIHAGGSDGLHVLGKSFLQTYIGSSAVKYLYKICMYKLDACTAL